MNFFKKIFTENKKTRESKKQIPWIQLTSLNQLDEILKESDENQLLFLNILHDAELVVWLYVNLRNN